MPWLFKPPLQRFLYQLLSQAARLERVLDPVCLITGSTAGTAGCVRDCHVGRNSTWHRVTRKT